MWLQKSVLIEKLKLKDIMSIWNATLPKFTATEAEGAAAAAAAAVFA